MAEPVVETGRADPRLAAGRERSIVKLGAEVARVGVGDDIARILLGAEKAPDEFVERHLFRSGDLDCAVDRRAECGVGHGVGHVVGCTRAGDRRTVCPTVPDCAMPLTNSKNWVERTIVYGIPDALIRFSWAILARR